MFIGNLITLCTIAILDFKVVRVLLLFFSRIYGFWWNMDKLFLTGGLVVIFNVMHSNKFKQKQASQRRTFGLWWFDPPHPFPFNMHRNKVLNIKLIKYVLASVV